MPDDEGHKGPGRRGRAGTFRRRMGHSARAAANKRRPTRGRNRATFKSDVQRQAQSWPGPAGERTSFSPRLWKSSQASPQAPGEPREQEHPGGTRSIQKQGAELLLQRGTHEAEGAWGRLPRRALAAREPGGAAGTIRCAENRARTDSADRWRPPRKGYESAPTMPRERRSDRRSSDSRAGRPGGGETTGEAETSRTDCSHSRTMRCRCTSRWALWKR